MKRRFSWSMLIIALAWCGASPALLADSKTQTAFALIQEGDKFVPPEAKDKITELRSEESDSSLRPKVWFIDYFDPTASFKRTELKFVDGKMVSMTRPARLFDTFSGGKELKWKKLRIDSDRALTAAMQLPVLKEMHVAAVQFLLTRTLNGSTWRIHFWAADPSADKTRDIGEVEISGKTGEIIDNRLRVKNFR